MGLSTKQTLKALSGALTILAAMLLMNAPTASALIAVPYLKVSPQTGAPGDTFTFGIAYGNVIQGCDVPVDYTVSGPDDPQGNEGPQIASGTLPATIPGNPPIIATGSVSPTIPGTYTIDAQAEPDTQGSCEGLVLQGTFQVTSPPPPPDTVTLTPASQSQPIDNTARVTATLTDTSSGTPVPGAVMTFGITGPNSSVNGTCTPADCTTDPDGQVTFTYAGTSTGDDTVNVSVGPFGGGNPTAAANVTWTPTVNGSRYAALGDSYSAGEGTLSYNRGTDIPGVNMCHRSPFSYASELDMDANLGSFAFVACSGAITDDLFSPNHSPNFAPSGDIEPAQLCQASSVSIAGKSITACGSARLPALGPDTRTVTLTIGGNDAGFSSVIKSCVWVLILGTNHGMPGRGCSGKSSVVEPALSRMLTLAGRGSATITESGVQYKIHSITSVIAAIHQNAPNAHVYIAGYPRLFQDTTGRDCQVGTATVNGKVGRPLEVAPFDASWLDGAASLLNAIVSSAAAGKPWATYVDVTAPFNGHGLCSADPWINSIDVNFTVNSSVLVQYATPSGDAHPTLQGQKDGYEAAFRAAGVGQ